jgi:CheY-like chemotaxis protein
MVMLQLEIQDSGQGIAPEQLQDIFEPFVQAGHSKTDIKGTGLGLAISKSFVDLLGGEISVESTPGIGSLFRVDLPVSLAKEIDADTDKAVSSEVIGLEPGQTAWRVLVVEDNTENRKLLTEILKQVGFEVREAENGKEAVAQFEQWQPHLICMDMRMPVMDGFEATKKIRELPGGIEVKIVAVTASALLEDHEPILTVGCDDIVCKPFQDHEIFDAMANHLGVKYIYSNRHVEIGQDPGLELLPEVLSELPPELLQELRRTTLVLDQEATLQVIERMKVHAPQTAESLQNMVEGLQMGRLGELLEEVSREKME